MRCWREKVAFSWMSRNGFRAEGPWSEISKMSYWSMEPWTVWAIASWEANVANALAEVSFNMSRRFMMVKVKKAGLAIAWECGFTEEKGPLERGPSYTKNKINYLAESSISFH